MIIECPHCFTKVMPSDGICPACRKDTRDTAGLDPSKTSIAIPDGCSLPPVCYNCGATTDRYVHATHTIGDAPTSWGSLLLGIFLGGLGRTLVEEEGRPQDSMEIYMPQCELCAVDGPPMAVTTSFEKYEMRFIVNKDFKEAVLRFEQESTADGSD